MAKSLGNIRHTVAIMRFFCLICLCATFALSPIAARAQSAAQAQSRPEMTDVQAKLAIIYNFVSRYVKWPDKYAIDKLNQVNICALGRDELTNEIDVLKRASTAKLQVNVVHNITYDQITACHVLYVATSESRKVSSILNYAQGSPVLTFSSLEDFTTRGGMISLVRETQRQGTFERAFIRFEVNAANVYSSRLYIDPDALELARKVVRE
ncbi:MAG: YfiR family protein [Rickettsiales bacterium]|nr:YfiR family protein [Rickettsiales bacterium]